MWKLNNKLLLDEKYCEMVENIIDYMAVDCAHLQPDEKWECIKMEVGYYSKKYSKDLARSKRLLETELRHRKEVLETENANETNCSDELLTLKAKLNEIEMSRAEASIFRSKCKYAKDGEKCTKYFFSLEKRRYLEKNMKCVYMDDGRCSTNQKDILAEQTRFYKELYTSDRNVDFVLEPEHGELNLSETERDYCDSDFMADEFYDAMMTLKNGKVPGIDGLTIEFYRRFWKRISPFLIEMYQFCYEKGSLPESMRKGLISLLPKPNKNTKFVKNNRPLTLLCNDYKILAIALDNRLRETIPKLINNDQTGFVKNRKISHNVRKSLDVMEYCKQKRLPGLICKSVSIDWNTKLLLPPCVISTSGSVSLNGLHCYIIIFLPVHRILDFYQNFGSKVGV